MVVGSSSSKKTVAGNRFLVPRLRPRRFGSTGAVVADSIPGYDDMIVSRIASFVIKKNKNSKSFITHTTHLPKQAQVHHLATVVVFLPTLQNTTSFIWLQYKRLLLGALRVVRFKKHWEIVFSNVVDNV